MKLKWITALQKKKLKRFVSFRIKSQPLRRLKLCPSNLRKLQKRIIVAITSFATWTTTMMRAPVQWTAANPLLSPSQQHGVRPVKRWNLFMIRMSRSTPNWTSGRSMLMTITTRLKPPKSTQCQLTLSILMAKKSKEWVAARRKSLSRCSIMQLKPHMLPKPKSLPLWKTGLSERNERYWKSYLLASELTSKFHLD